MNIIAQFKAKLASKIAELREEKAASKAKDETIAGLQGAIGDKNKEIYDLKASIQALNPERLNAKIAELEAVKAEYEKAFADAMGDMDALVPVIVPSAGNIDDSRPVPSAGNIDDGA